MQFLSKLLIYEYKTFCCFVLIFSDKFSSNLKKYSICNKSLYPSGSYNVMNSKILSIEKSNSLKKTENKIIGKPIIYNITPPSNFDSSKKIEIKQIILAQRKNKYKEIYNFIVKPDEKGLVLIK